MRMFSMCEECGKRLPEIVFAEIPSEYVLICHKCYSDLMKKRSSKKV